MQKPRKMQKKATSKIEQIEKGRKTKNASLTGATGTGKTTKAIQILKKLLASKASKVLVITFNGSGESWDHVPEIKTINKKTLSYKRGWKKIIWARWREDKEMKILKEVYQYYRNGYLVFDDCKMYMKPNIDHTPYLAQICCDHRHHGYDMFFIAHTPRQIPVDVWSYINFSWVFMCLRKFKENDLQCENGYKLVEAQSRINKKCKNKELKKQPIWGIFEFVRM